LFGPVSRVSGRDWFPGLPSRLSLQVGERTQRFSAFNGARREEAHVTRKQIVYVAAVVLLTSTLATMVAYRLGIRQAGRRGGLESAPGAVAGCLDFREAQSHTGQTGCITGRVLRAYTSRSGVTFLDFCPDYRNCAFSGVIFASDRSKFGDLTTLGSRQVEIRGPIVSYQGRAEIILHDPEQLHVVP
jgi:hypothetical protein